MKINIPLFTEGSCKISSSEISPINSWETINEGDTIQFVRCFQGSCDMQFFWELENFSWPRLQKSIAKLFIPDFYKYPSRKFIKRHFCLISHRNTSDCISNEDGFKTFEIKRERYSEISKQIVEDFLRSRVDSGIGTLIYNPRQ